MPNFKFKGEFVATSGPLPKLESKAPDFTLTRNDLSEVQLSNFESHYKVLSVFPSVDTPVCATSVRQFNKKASEHHGVIILNISADLPFAQERFCGNEGIDNVEVLSTFRTSFARDYGLEIMEGPLKGLCARSVLVLDKDNHVIFAELVADLTQEPNYERVFEAMMNDVKMLCGHHMDALHLISNPCKRIRCWKGKRLSLF